MTQDQTRTAGRMLASAVSESKAPAISRAAAVLRLLGKSDQPLSLQAIARELGLVPSTCLYVLRALVAEELVAVHPTTKRYTLEAGVLTLARQWLRRNPFTELVQPVLDRTAEAFDVTMLGVQIVGLDHIIAVAVSRSTGNFQLSTEVGSRFPALISATGRCIAAFGGHPPEELEARFKTLRWDDPPGFTAWMAQVAEARTRGYGIDEGNYIAGVTVVAAPVWNSSGPPSHALVAIGLGSTLRRRGVPELAQEMVASGHELSRQLGGEPR